MNWKDLNVLRGKIFINTVEYFEKYSIEDKNKTLPPKVSVSWTVCIWIAKIALSVKMYKKVLK